MTVLPGAEPAEAADASGSFGAGGAEPWARSLRDGGALALVPEGGVAQDLDVSRWSGVADDADRSAIEGLRGPVLDVGCGPGRMIRAALDAGLAATGIDVAEEAVRHCRDLLLPVLHRSVFDPLPREGAWGSVLLIDGNVGIGGDPATLLARCAALLAPGGAVVAEAHPDPRRDVVFTGRVVRDGRSSAPFRWAEAGEHALVDAAGPLALEAAWTAADRRFLRFRAV
ncbi:methyltransferase domain-containing protein [Amnibacterium endophyticum]|uniref:Methyltransferase domain-containing protein n=1 Tax=Amnibacterium endophyticum TaxID=2109337 RepID=A0ABW4LHD1_9MICO